jgi:uncharacterized protein (UPF0276 family)
MKLAINYSPAAAALFQAGKIQIDFFKCPPWPDMIATAQALCPVAIHFELTAGTGRLHETEWAVIDEFQALTGTPYVNLHLAALTDHFPGMAADTQEPADACRVVDALLNDVCAVVERFGPENVIAENVMYYGRQSNYLRPAILPATIRQVCEETGCGLLLDISHARIAARYLGMDEKTYLRQLPTERLREMHFTGIHEIGQRPQDHLSAQPADWDALAWVLERIQTGEWARPWLLAFEYGGVGKFFGEHCDAGVIAEQVPRLWQMIHGLRH